ncbi:MAG: signal peptidase II [Lachnospiraceae bacterium]|nr:signal peptidase II [Lachnospiraceae bacterium]
MLLLFISVLVLVILDQWTKHLAVMYLKDKEPSVLWQGVFELRYLENRGAAFGMLKDQRIVFLIMTVIIMAGTLWIYLKMPQTKRFLPLRLIAAGILAGAAGNMIDRLFNGYVVDFFYFSLIDFPIFNVADIYVTVSSFMLLLLYFFFYKEEEFDFLFRKKEENPVKEVSDQTAGKGMGDTEETGMEKKLKDEE